MTLKNAQLKSQIMKADQQIKHKEEMGDDLKFIDFHQLQIENKKHVKDIDERNKKLLNLKTVKGKTDQTLNSLKNKLTKAIEESDKLSKDIVDKTANLKQTTKTIADTEKMIRALIKSQRVLEGKQNRAKDMPEVQDYVNLKKDINSLGEAHKNWTRKIEIAEISAKEAKRRIRTFQKAQEEGM